MMQAYILKCPEQGRFHFGKTAPDSDIALSVTSDCFHSDTLFSALVVLCAKYFPKKVNDFVAYFEEQEILISSGNYCLDLSVDGDLGKRIFFLPKPIHFNLHQIENKDRKFVKQIQYISKTIWEKGLMPKDWEEEKCFTIDQRFLLHPEDMDKGIADNVDSFFEIISEPKIADHARKKINNIFFQTDVMLKTTRLNRKILEQIGFDDFDQLSIQPHFYFLVQFIKSNEHMEQLFKLLLEILVDEGIGGGISVGCGKVDKVHLHENWQFEMEKEEISTTQFISGSLLSVADSAELKSVLAGDIIVRGGRQTARHGELQRVKMLMEGALINGDVKGKIPDLIRDENKNPMSKENQRYLRYGIAFPISIHLNYQMNYHES